ncbi:neuropeptide Y receptor type 2-like [Oculina patagonica]
MNHSSIENPSPAPVSRGVIFADISLLAIGFLAGTFGNGRACLLLRKRRDLRKVPHYLFASLSVVGFLSSLVSFFGWLVLIVISNVLNFKVPEVLCFIITPFIFACIKLNAMTLSLMAIDRQDCVLRPFHRRITPRNVETVILVTWCVALVFTSVFVFFEVFASDSVCRNFDPYTLPGKLTTINSFATYVVASAMLQNVATFLTIVITFIRILKKLRSSPIPHSNSVQDRRERKITNFTYRSCAIFAVCWLPASICNLLVRFGGFDWAKMKAAQVLAITIAKFTYVVIPFLHHKMLKERTAPNQIFAMAALNDGRTLARADHLACNAVARQRDIADVARARGSEVEELRELPGVLTCQNSP